MRGRNSTLDVQWTRSLSLASVFVLTGLTLLLPVGNNKSRRCIN